MNLQQTGTLARIIQNKIPFPERSPFRSVRCALETTGDFLRVERTPRGGGSADRPGIEAATGGDLAERHDSEAHEPRPRHSASAATPWALHISCGKGDIDAERGTGKHCMVLYNVGPRTQLHVR